MTLPVEACEMVMWSNNVRWSYGQTMWDGHLVKQCEMVMWSNNVRWSCGQTMWDGHVVKQSSILKGFLFPSICGPTQIEHCCHREWFVSFVL